MSKKAKRTGYPLNSTRRAAAPADVAAATHDDSHSAAPAHHETAGHNTDHHGHDDGHHGDHHADDHHKDDHSQN